MSKRRKFLTLVGVGLVAAAVVTELRKPPDERTWEGTLGGVVPYDLRPPTAERVMQRLWAPGNATVFTPHIFGVGWSMNLGRLARRAGIA